MNKTECQSFLGFLRYKDKEVLYMKKQTLISLLCAGVLTAGAVTGLMGFANINTATDISTTSDKKVELISSSDIDTAEVSTDGTITGVSDVAAAVMPAVVSITNKSV